MKKCLFAAIMLCIVASSFAQNSPAEKYVKAFSERKNKWLIEKNYDSLRTLLDNRCLYVHSNGWTQTAADVMNDLKSGKLVYNKMTVEESTARQFEKMVIVNGKGKFEGSVDGKAFNLHLAYTEVYINRKNGWTLVSRHSNKLDQ